MREFMPCIQSSAPLERWMLSGLVRNVCCKVHCILVTWCQVYWNHSNAALWSPLYLYILATEFWLQLKEDKKEKLTISSNPSLLSTPCISPQLCRAGYGILSQDFISSLWGDQAQGNQSTIFQNSQVAEGSIYKHAYMPFNKDISPLPDYRHGS